MERSKFIELFKAEIEFFKQSLGDEYANNSKENRKYCGQFFTPPELVYEMIMKFPKNYFDENGNIRKTKDDRTPVTILDPTCGSGNLLMGCLLMGADPKFVFGIELDSKIANLCRKRLSNLGVPEHNIVIGSALEQKSFEKLAIANAENVLESGNFLEKCN